MKSCVKDQYIPQIHHRYTTDNIGAAVANVELASGSRAQPLRTLKLLAL